MDAKDEALSVLHKMWVKLQILSSANPVDLGAFLVILTFMREFPPSLSQVDGGRGSGPDAMLCFSVTFLLMTVGTCASYCCHRKTKTKDTGI